MLDTGNLYDLYTNPNIEEWTSRTWEIDWENNRLLSKRIDGKQAVAQSVLVTLSTDYLKFPIFSDRFGSAERLIKDAVAPDLRILKVRDFRIEERDKFTIEFLFTLECEDGLVDLSWEVLLE